MIASFVLILVTGSILTDDAPTWCRLVGIIPLAALLIALVLDEFLNVFERTSLKPFVPFLLVGVALFLGVLAVTDWDTYLKEVGNANSVRSVVFVARYLAALPDEVNACGITDEYRLDQEEIKFLGWPRSIEVVPPETAALTPDSCPGKNLVWILAPTYHNRLPELQAQWPGGTVEDHRRDNGDLMFTSYLISNKTNP